MAVYKIKYVVIAEDENGKFIEQVNEEYLNSEEEAKMYINRLIALDASEDSESDFEHPEV